MNTKVIPLIVFTLFCGSASLAQDEDSLREAVSFREDIKPILAEKCVHCHNRKTLPALFSFESAKRAFVTLESGQEVIVRGEPEKSLIVTALRSPVGHEKTMPMVGPRPTMEEIELIRRWIEEGAEWPKGPAGWIRPTFRATE